jgi:hypothetical protein
MTKLEKYAPRWIQDKNLQENIKLSTKNGAANNELARIRI